ncbi:MAG: hypothetical protein A3H50_02440 [Candidatus Levybacteria bacterium RIFCSPLOWO2_02_FULL_37_10]|nr:MAG: hypothetical protein A2860_04455 [Candidatus Levybacteria bacterium RIFCSPHIGHO2_01_FULL_37_33]OGH33174.1 MAG: hypothetical protein A2953_02670 [Candidatus Levybacteria bacterium RIFCSPLOWO2_01_FULL_36_54]OGH46060.1 MAG: hypothetical protein A3H50_02440 [Candidatus Levybacteria bacterium RIFCSPLOWO2_02_FULL_37_10]
MFALGSIKFGDFWWTYHKNYPEAPLAPMYFDIRMVRRNQIIRGRPVDILQNAVNGLEFHLIADIPTAMTPTVTLLAERLGLGMVSPRKEAKDKGSGEMVDGFLREDKGATAVLIDDVLARGDSKLIYAENLKKAGAKVEDIVVLMDYEIGGKEILEQSEYRVHLLDYLNSVGIIEHEKWEKTLERLKEIREYFNRVDGG